MPDPAHIPEDKLEAAYLESLHNPIGAKPISDASNLCMKNGEQFAEDEPNHPCCG